MKPHAFATLLLALGGSTLNAQPELLESADYWQAQGRADLARQAVEKLLMTRPGDPALLYRLGEIDLALDPEHCSEPVARMRRHAPDDYRTQALIAECYTATTGRLRMARIMQLHQSGQHQQAAADLLELFQHGPPLSRTGLVYFQILESAGYPAEQLRPGLERLQQRFPEDPEIQLTYADLLAGDPASAGEAIRRARLLSQIPEHRDAALKIWRRALKHPQGQARQQELLTQYLRADPDNTSIRDRKTRLGTSNLRPHARRLSDKGDASGAIRLLQKGLRQRPDDAWLRYDLARLLLEQERPQDAAALMQNGLERRPRSADMRHASALIFRALNDDERAWQTLSAIPSTRRSGSITTLWRALSLRHCLDQATRREQLLACEAFMDDDPKDWNALMDAWSGIDPPTGAARLQSWLHTQEKPPLSLVLRLLDLQVELDGTWPLTLQRALALSAESEDHARVRQLAHQRFRLLAGEHWARNEAARARHAYLLASKEYPPTAGSDWFALAEFERQMGEAASAAQSLQQGLALQPDAHWQRIRLAEVLADTGDTAAALEQLDLVLQYQGEDADKLGHVAMLRWRNIDSPAGSRARLQRAIEQHPESVALRLLAAGQASDEPAQAFLHLQFAYQLASKQGFEEQAQQAADRMARMQADRAGYAVVGWDRVDKPGSTGISRLRQDTFMLEMRQPLGWHGHWGLQIDRISADAGNLPRQRPRDYAQYALVPPNQRAAANPGPLQRALGAAIALRLDWKPIDAELAWLALGNSESGRLLGRINYRRPLGQHQLRLGLERRPQDSTLLAFAGRQDPVSGEFWGPITRDSASVGLARYQHASSYQLGLRLDRLTGPNAADNQGLRLGLGGSRELWHSLRHHLYIDGSLRYWRYQESLGEYSFGHGGYYSPNSYLSGRLGLDWRYLRARLSARGRLGMGYSDSSRDAQIYFPADAALQAQAEAFASSIGESAPRYAGGGGGGSGLSADLQVEYALDRAWTLGLHYALDRADFYEPDFFGFYLRREWPWGRAIPYSPPQPPRPIARF